MRWIVALIILCCPVSGIPQGSAVPSAAPAELVVGQPLGAAYRKPDTTAAPKQETRQAAQKPGSRKSIGKALIFVGGALLIIFLIF